MSWQTSSWVVALALGALACGGDAFTPGGNGGSGATTTSSGGGGGQGGTTTTSSGGGGGQGGTTSTTSSSGTGGGCSGQGSGDCQNGDNCLSGNCVELTPCGFKVCETPLDEATVCDNNEDQCCDSGDCDAGACHEWPWGAYCGGVQPQPHNVCAIDECGNDNDCPAPPPEFLTICAPADTLGYPMRHCLLSGCRTNDDCGDEPGGICAPVTTSCCSSPNIMLCTYPSNGCRKDSDCLDGYCGQEGVRALCMPGTVPCPA